MKAINENWKIKKILCPTFSSERSETAIKFAAYLANINDATLLICHRQSSSRWLNEKISQENGQRPDKKVENLPESLDYDIKKFIQTGEPNWQLAAYAKENKVNLDTLTARPEKNYAEYIFPVWLRNILNYTNLPVLTIPAKIRSIKIKDIYRTAEESLAQIVA